MRTQKKKNLTLKDVKLPKDPMGTDQEDSDVSSLDETRRALDERLKQMPKVEYNLPQNMVPVLGDSFFADQAVNAQVYDLEVKQRSEYSPTGNSWYQSDIDSEYHRFDPGRYPGRKQKPENPQESDSVSVGRSSAQGFDHRRIINTNTVTSFSDLVNQRFSQQTSQAKKQRRPSAQRRGSKMSQGRKRSNSRRQSVSRHKIKRDSTLLTEQSGITQREIDEIEKLARNPQNKSRIQEESRRRRNTKIPTIMINEVTPASPPHEYHHHATFTQKMSSSSTQRVSPSGKHQSENRLPDLSKLRTLSPTQISEQDLRTPSSSSGMTTPLDRVTPPLTTGRDSKIRIQGGQKPLHEQKRNLGQNFSFRNLNASPSALDKLQTKQVKRDVESTPERILREFNEKAKAYRLNLGAGETNQRPNASQKWHDLMKECKDEWELTTACLYNPSPMVLYDAYLVNLSHTIAAKLSQIYGRNVRVNLRQGNPFKKIQINVTTVHQSKFCLTKKGNGFGYGTKDKLSPEDAFLKTVFENVSPEGVKMRQRRFQRETLAQIVPPIIKKPPRPVKDSLQALHLTCRRGIPIDRNGMPFLVEKDHQSREFYRALLKRSNNVHHQSNRSHSLNNQESLYMRILLGDQEASSMAQLSSVKKQQRSKTNNAKSPKKHQYSAQQSQQWIQKVDSLIEKFDQSFKQNEEQQKSILEAQKELKQAKQDILHELKSKKNQKRLENGDHSASDDSYKRDSCVASSDDDQADDDNRADGNRTFGTESAASDLDHRLSEMERTMKEKGMRQTFQSNDERQEYHLRLEDMHEKYAQIESEASNALKSQWDTRQELRKMSKPQANKSSLKQSKMSFKRDLKKDKVILNDRSGDLINDSTTNFMSPQQLFTHLENAKIKKEAVLAKMSPFQRSQASKLHLSSSRNYQNSQYLSQTKAILASGFISKGESMIEVGNLNQTSNPSIKYRPSPQPSPPRSPPLNANDSASRPRFDINEAQRQEAVTARNNISIMSQLNSSSGQPPYPQKAQLPRQVNNAARKQQYGQNKDISVFISTSPKRSPKKTISASKRNLINNGTEQNEAYQTMTELKQKKGEDDKQMLPELSSREGPRHQMHHLTMTDINSTFTPQNNRRNHNAATNEDLQNSYILAPGFGDESTGGQNPMLTTMFASEEFNTNAAAPNSDIRFAEGGKTVKMQIVDEADEVESIQRPSFFDALNHQKKKVSPKNSSVKFETVTQTTSKTVNVPQFNSLGKQRVKQESQATTLTASPSTARKSFTIQALKDQRDQMQKDEISQIKKAKVPSFSLPPRSKIVTTQGPAQVTTTTPMSLRSTRGKIPIVNLKPINQTGLSRFRAPYKSCRTSTIDTGLDQIRKTTQTKDGPMTSTVSPNGLLSPFQMMLEEMKQRDGQELVRPTVEEMDDFNDFQGEDQRNNPGGHFLAYEEKLEQMMKTYSSAFGGGGAGIDDENYQTILSQLAQNNRHMNFTKASELGKTSLEAKHKKPYFKNQPPLNDTFTKVLERKYRETDANFREEARNLVEGVRNLEQTSRNGGQFAQTVGLSQFDKTKSTFKGRGGSLGHQFSAKNKSLKEQLSMLKLAEKNQNPKNTALSLSRRRKTEFAVQMNKTGFETTVVAQDETDYGLRPTLIRDQDHLPNYRQGQELQFAASSLQDSSSYQYGMQNQVQYSFKKFKLDSQKDHTKHLLPSMKKII